MQNNKLVFIALCLLALVLAVNGAGLLRARRGLTEDADRILRQSDAVDTNNVGQLADLVAKNGAEECLARVICELTQNPKSHGDPGSRFGKSLLKFRQSRHPKVRKYTDAMTFGASAKSGHECKSHYAHCSHSTQEVVMVGNRIFKN